MNPEQIFPADIRRQGHGGRRLGGHQRKRRVSEGEYFYSFCIDDIYGDYYQTDPVVFYVDGSGEVSF